MECVKPRIWYWEDRSTTIWHCHVEKLFRISKSAQVRKANTVVQLNTLRLNVTIEMHRNRVINFMKIFRPEMSAPTPLLVINKCVHYGQVITCKYYRININDEFAVEAYKCILKHSYPNRSSRVWYFDDDLCLKNLGTQAIYLQKKTRVKLTMKIK